MYLRTWADTQAEDHGLRAHNATQTQPCSLLILGCSHPILCFAFPYRELESRDPFPFWIAALISLKATVCPVGPLLAMFIQYVTSTEAWRGLGPPSVLPLCHYFYPMPLCTFTLSHTTSGSTCFQFKLPSESHLEYCHVPHHACLPYR